MEHIVFTDKHKDELTNIALGMQTMVIRSTQSRRIPHSRVFKGEVLYFAKKGDNEILYQGEVKEVYNYNKLMGSEVDSILKANQKKLLLDDEELNKHKKKCICIVEFENVKSIDPIKIKPQSTLVDWIILDDIAILKD